MEGLPAEVTIEETAALGSVEPGRTPEGGGPGGEGHRGVAVLLGLAAILAAIVGVRATALSSDATDAWQSALRTEVKRSAGALEDVRYLYQAELPPVVTILGARAQELELRAAAAKETGATADALTREADVQAGLLAAIAPTYEFATHPAYALPGGGVNLGLRLSDVRAANPGLVALNPDTPQATGDALAAKAGAMTLPLLPIGFGALFGALVQPFAGRRRSLLAVASAALAIGAVAAVAAELLA